MIKTYTELTKLITFKDRYSYLRLRGAVGEETFGFDRFINQTFYTSPEWRRVRDEVIVRDNGRDLGVEGYEIYGQKVFIHHMNPILIKDILYRSELLLDPEYLITTTFETHNAIHYGDEGLIIKTPIERKPNDTIPWK